MSILEMKFRGSTLKEKLLFVAIAIMTAGQWADSKELATEAYVAFISNFTHTYEYEALNTVNIGSNVDFISQTFGSPQLIKKSKYNDNLSFAYYLHEKYILTLILDNSRVTAYTITGLVPEFYPHGLLDKAPSIGKSTVAEFIENMIDFTVDYNNVEYLLVREELGKDRLFINRFFGAIGYQQDTNVNTAELRGLYDIVNMDEENSEIPNKIKDLTSKARNNFFAAGEVGLSTIADSVLTNFEYSFYFKQ